MGTEDEDKGTKRRRRRHRKKKYHAQSIEEFLTIEYMRDRTGSPLPADEKLKNEITEARRILYKYFEKVKIAQRRRKAEKASKASAPD